MNYAAIKAFKTMPRVWSVWKCKNGKTTYLFPREERIRAEWVSMVAGGRVGRPPRPNSTAWSDHFSAHGCKHYCTASPSCLDNANGSNSEIIFVYLSERCLKCLISELSHVTCDVICRRHTCATKSKQIIGFYVFHASNFNFHMMASTS